MTQHRPAISSVHRRKLTLILGLGLLAVLYVPALLPVPVISSESYVFGYNNRAGVLILLAVLAGAGLYFRRNGLTLSAPERTSSPSDRDSAPALSALLFALAVTSVLCLGIRWLAGPYGGLNESRYFIDRIQLLASGKILYKEFEFAYGPFMAYVPVWLSRCLHLSLPSGYYLFWALNHLLGTVLLWFFVKMLRLPGITGSPRMRTQIFLAVWAFQAIQITDAGVNYGALRVVLPLFLLLWLHRLHERWLLFTAFACASVVLLLAFSPEQGIAFALVTLAYLPLRHGLHKKILLPWIAVACISAAAIHLAARTGIFLLMHAMSAGGYNDPVFLNIYILLFFAALLMVALWFFSAPLHERMHSNAALILLYSCITLTAALGRCDPLHLVDNEAGLLCCAFTIAWQWNKPWKRAMLSYSIFFLAIPLLLLPLTMGPAFGKAILSHIYSSTGPQGRVAVALDRKITQLAVRHFGPELAAQKLENMRATVGRSPAAQAQPFADATAIVYAPFFYLPNSMSTSQSASVDAGYFSGTTDVLLPAQVQQKIEELASYPDRDLLVPEDMLRYCHEDGATARKSLRYSFLTPVLLPVRHDNDIAMPLCDYITAHYTLLHPPTPATAGYGLWRRLNR